ncbi:MAG: MtrB/PioB family decaheme-associated outer membrane protein [Burkholderiaceae bacterium]|nr:MtrB/PioB family decaheme-associated outer membrane protein [Burkholderiaceae bacterium]
MSTTHWHPGIGRTAVALALLAACGGAHAQAGKKDATEAEGSVTVGVGVAGGDSADRAIFGQYNGLRDDRSFGLLDFEYYRRTESGSSWTRLQGTGVLGENRELEFLWKRQGDWKFSVDYSELVRHEPYTINTGLLGAGTTAPQVVHLAGGAGSGSNLDLRTRRQGLGLGFTKWLGEAMELRVSLKSENKDGARLSGRGFNCPTPVAPGCAPTTGANPGWAVLMVPEPIDANHSQVQARLSYAGDRLRLNGGYYGSFYNNAHGALAPGVPGSLNSPLGVLQPLNAGLQPILNQAMALPPDNQAHHFDVSGVYVFTPTTRANFKLGYARATQDQGFAGAGLLDGPVAITDLDGRVDTTLAQIGITSRPMPKLSLLAEMRHEDRDDKTPLALYNVEGAVTYTNRHYPYTKTRGKLQASYQFTPDYRGALGADYEAIDRGVFTPSSSVSGISALRQETEEIGYRAELRRRMSDNVSGAISFVTSRRDGSAWLWPNTGLGVSPVEPGAIITSAATFMPSLADRRRDKVRVFAVWQPSDALTLQAGVDTGRDRFSSPSDHGLRRTGMDTFSVDWDYVLSAHWTLNGYLSRGNQTLAQSRPGGYVMAFDNDNTSIGIGAVGRPTGKLEIGGTLSFFNDRNEYAQTLDPTANAGSAALLAATGGLPDIVFRTTEIRLFGRYTVSKTSSLRLDLIHYRARFNDWAYGYDGTAFLFSDNTTLTQQYRQNVTFVGLTYTHRWQ